MKTQHAAVLAFTLAPGLGLHSQQPGTSSTEQGAQEHPATDAEAAEGQTSDASVPESFRPRNWFGYGSTWIGDVNADGWHDVAVPDSTYTPEGEPITRYGAVFILSGADGNVIRVLEPKEGESSFGWATADLDDLDEDGLGEVLVLGQSGQGEDARSFGRAISPATGRVHWNTEGLPRKTWTTGMRAAGDFDGDGREDILAWGGIPRGSPDAPSMAKTVVLSGRDGRFLSDVSVAHEGWNCIVDACLVQDLDGDGRRDVAIGAYQDSGTASGGAVEIRSSSSGGLLRRFAHPLGRKIYGSSLAVADLDGSGNEELLITASDSMGRFVDPPAGLDCVYVHDLSAGDTAPLRVTVPGAGGDKVIAVVSDPRNPQPKDPGSAPVPLEVLDHHWAGSEALLLVADHRSFDGEVRCFSLSTGARLWNLGGRDSVKLDPKSDMTSHLGEFLAIASSPDSHGLPALAGTANHYWENNHTVVCFDVLSGEPRFVLDARTAYEKAGLFLPRDFPTSEPSWAVGRRLGDD